MSRTSSGVETMIVPLEKWDALVDQCDLRTIYHRASWVRAIERSEGVKFHLVACKDERGLLAVWPISIIRKGPLRIGASPLPGWNTCYMGPLFTAACEKKLDSIQAMLASSPVSNPSFITTRCMDVDLDWSGIGFQRTKGFDAFELDLHPSENELFSGLKGTCRTRVRKGIKLGIEVIFEEGDEYIDSFLEMAMETYAKSGLKSPYSEGLLRSMFDELSPRGELLVPSAFYEGERVATLIIPHDDRTGMFFAGATYAEKRALPSNNLLHWEAIRRCKEMGMVCYDFHSTCGQPGRFKSTFGPVERMNCAHWERAKNPLIKWLKDKYEQRARAKRKAISSSTDS